MTSATHTSRPLPQRLLVWKWHIVALVLFMSVLIGLAYGVGVSLRPYQLHGTVFEPAQTITDFTFTNALTGEPLSIADLKGQVVLLFFGYANCPDVCPTTLADYAQVFDKLGPKSEQVTLLWVTVDPERDTPQLMVDYINHFNKDFIGLIPPSAEALEVVAEQFYVHYEKQDVGSQTGYLVDHTASVMALDKAGQWRVLYSFNTPIEDVVNDLLYLIEE